MKSGILPALFVLALFASACSQEVEESFDEVAAICLSTDDGRISIEAKLGSASGEIVKTLESRCDLETNAPNTIGVIAEARGRVDPKRSQNLRDSVDVVCDPVEFTPGITRFVFGNQEQDVTLPTTQEWCLPDPLVP